jgi:predicted ATPase
LASPPAGRRRRAGYPPSLAQHRIKKLDLSYIVPPSAFVTHNRTDVKVVDLGRFRLKNVGRPFELYAVAAEGVVVPDAEALEGKGERFAGLPANLSQPASPLIGRTDDLASLMQLVRQHRMVTVTGPGGVGKTRVVLELGRQLAPEFLEDVAFIAFSEVRDADDFIPVLAAALDVKEAEGRTLAAGVATLIGRRKALLLLDNLEQIVAAARQVSELVDRCPELRVVSTSRTPLRIAAEREYTLVPLAIPSSGGRSPDSLMSAASVALFVERARTIRASFRLTAANAEAVAGVCRRLDGLPLAIELAAARLRLLGPEALLERLGYALDLLESGARDAPERHRTLRATIEWSHALLTESERRLFRRMAVFAGACTLVDLEAVCADQGDRTLDDLESLVDQALYFVNRWPGVRISPSAPDLNSLECLPGRCRDQSSRGYSPVDQYLLSRSIASARVISATSRSGRPTRSRSRCTTSAGTASAGTSGWPRRGRIPSRQQARNSASVTCKWSRRMWAQRAGP